MEKRSKYSLITTILNSAFGVVVLVLLFVEGAMLFGVSKAFGISGETISEASNHDLTGGYEVLGGLAIGILGALGAMALIGIIFVSIAVLLMLIATIIVGLVSRSSYRNNKPVKFVADSVVKIVVDGLIAIVCILSASVRQPFWIITALVPATVVVLCIISLCEKAE